MFICHAHLTSISFHPAVCAQACGLEHLCHYRALLDIRFRDIFGLCVGVTIAVTRHCHFCKRFRDGRSTVGSGARRGTKPWRGNGKESTGTRQWDHGLAKNRFRASKRQLQRAPAVNGSATFDLGNIIAEPPRWIAFATAQRRESDCSRCYHGRCAGATQNRMPRQLLHVQRFGYSRVSNGPHWDEVLIASQEDNDFCEDGETTTIARD